MRGPSITACVVLPALALATQFGCYVVPTEIVDSAHSVRLCGAGFRVAEPSDKTVPAFSWDASRGRYLASDQTLAVRFARLMGEAYLAEIRPLRENGAPVKQSYYFIAIVRADERPLRARIPRCNDMQGLARGYGVTAAENIETAEQTALGGTRAATLGFLIATLDCKPSRSERRFLEVELAPEAVIEGGPPMASLAAAYDPELYSAPVSKRCDDGSAVACAEAGDLYATGEMVPRDAARAANDFEKACTGGSVRGCVGLAARFERGDGRPHDIEHAISLFHKACEGDEPFACAKWRQLTSAPLDTRR